MKGFSYQTTNSDLMNTVWKTDCKKKAHAGHVSQDKHLYNSGKELPDNSTQKADHTNSCNNSIQIILAVNNLLPNPKNGEQSVFHYSPLLTSQIFTTQEPDPPQIG